MHVNGIIFALDLGAAATGVATGCPNERPSSRVIPLKRKDEESAIAFANLMAFLGEEWIKSTPALVVKEAPLPLQGFAHLGNSQAAVEMTYGLHAIVSGLAARFNIPCKDAHPSSVRRHFIGKARVGTRAATKVAVVQRCHLLGYMPRHINEDNQADALAIWDFASATFGGRAAKVLHLFGEKVA